jgi:hypothetical protein
MYGKRREGCTAFADLPCLGVEEAEEAEEAIMVSMVAALVVAVAE